MPELIGDALPRSIELLELHKRYFRNLRSFVVYSDKETWSSLQIYKQTQQGKPG